MRYLLILLVFVIANASAQKCDSIQRVEKGGSKYLTTPERDPITFIKAINVFGDTVYYASLTLKPNISLNGKGVMIRLANGEGVYSPKATVSTDSFLGHLNAYSTIVLTKEDLSKLLNHEITRFELMVSEQSVSDGKKYKDYFNCLVGMNP